jgi:hypothetical protein
VAEEFLPFLIGGRPVFFARSQRATAGDEGAVAVDDLFGVDGLVSQTDGRSASVRADRRGPRHNRATLGAFAEGWAQPGQGLWYFTTCLDDHLLLRYEVDDVIDAQQYAVGLGDRLEQAFGSIRRRHLAHTGDHTGHVDPRFWRTASTACPDAETPADTCTSVPRDDPNVAFELIDASPQERVEPRGRDNDVCSVCARTPRTARHHTE